ncbi:MAG: hypothetical protein F6K19_50315 [Cyanothece sp. SIO1E1]|nr:hypothetical protein [Cyanothece sp. SIO1E1]
MPSLAIRPGVFVRLKGQPEDLPDFLVDRCVGDRCWLRQQSWGKHVQLRVRITQIAVPESQATSTIDLFPLPGRQSRCLHQVTSH